MMGKAKTGKNGVGLCYRQESMFDWMDTDGAEEMTIASSFEEQCCSQPPSAQQASELRRKREYCLTRILMRIGMPAHMVGSAILQEAVLMTLEEPEACSQLMHGLYPRLAEHFQSTVSRVERDMRTAIAAAWERGAAEPAVRLLGPAAAPYHGKPTNRELISLLTRRVQMEMPQEP